MEKIYKLNKTDLEEKLLEKLKNITDSKLFVTEDKLKQHLTENEILDLLDKGILNDKFLE